MQGCHFQGPRREAGSWRDLCPFPEPLSGRMQERTIFCPFRGLHLCSSPSRATLHLGMAPLPCAYCQDCAVAQLSGCCLQFKPGGPKLKQTPTRVSLEET